MIPELTPFDGGALPTDPNLTFAEQQEQCRLYQEWKRDDNIPETNVLIDYINNQLALNKGDDGLSMTYIGVYSNAVVYTELNTVSNSDGELFLAYAGDVPIGTPLSNATYWNQLTGETVSYKGAYDNATAYEFMDRVTELNSTYEAKQDVPAGTPVANTTYWLHITGLNGDPTASYNETTNPTATINPPAHTFWINRTDGSLWITQDITPNANIWINSFTQQVIGGATLPTTTNTFDFFGDGSATESFNFDTLVGGDTYDSLSGLSSLIFQGVGYTDIAGKFDRGLKLLIGGFEFFTGSIVVANSFTLSQWINLDTTATSDLFNLNTAGFDYLTLKHDSALGLILHSTMTNTDILITNHILTPNQYKLVTLQFDNVLNGIVRIMVDGVEVGTTTLGVIFPSIFTNLSISSSVGNLGSIKHYDQLRIFNKALTNVEHLSLFEDEV